MLNLPVPPDVARGRYAPSPTGLLHVGCARTALAAWLSVRAQGGVFAWRVEDLDPPRTVAGAAEAAMADLAWLGLDWDEGPDVGGPYGPYYQSERGICYEEALAQLFERGALFPCSYSRKDLMELASAPHDTDGGRMPYPASLRPETLAAGWFEAFRTGEGPGAAIRYRVHDRPVTFHDRLQGPITERVDQTVGDFVLKRRDGLYAYQLAVVVDDLLMNVTEVVRGTDLLGSTARQIQLIEALGAEPPTYAHVPLVVDANGKKLSKRNRAIMLQGLRERRVAPEALVGYLGYSLGMLGEPAPCTPHELVPHFAWANIPKENWRLPDDLPERLQALA